MPSGTLPSDSVLSLQVHEVIGHRVGKVLPCQHGPETRPEFLSVLLSALFA